ncbi:MAG TPA: zf-HC2 domain-containing protein [Kineosporiaceae bacterium]|jgi:anti-sigma factor RsiW|nr:zf-HC2 domain-containing protein [Kineosporiaceae bacterium]
MTTLACERLVELLGDYLEGTLPPGAAADLEEHLRTCRGCSAVLDQLRDTVGLLGAHGVPDAADELPADVRAGLVAAFGELRGRDRS